MQNSRCQAKTSEVSFNNKLKDMEERISGLGKQLEEMEAYLKKMLILKETVRENTKSKNNSRLKITKLQIISAAYQSSIVRTCSDSTPRFCM